MLIFSDLHANKRALEDIIPILENVDLSVFCGDLLGYGKDIEYCMDFVLKHVDIIALGNHERMVITDEDIESQVPDVKESILYTRSKLSLEQKMMLSALPKEIYYEDMYVTHSIGDDYLRTKEDFKRIGDNTQKDIRYIFFGHTHEQVAFKYKNKTIVNPGSITKGRRGFKRSYVLINDDKIQFVNLENIL